MDDREIDRIIKHDKPGFRRVQRGASRRDRAAVDADATADEAGGLELAELRRQYLGNEAEILGDAGTTADDADEDDDDDEVVIVTPDAGVGFDAGLGAKTVIISGKEKRIVLEQG